jgi:hypothetical protein
MKWNLPNMILIAGNGRNVGKTTFATNIIRHLSESTTVIGIKVSPHIHDINDGLVLISKTDDFVVAEERGHNKKDSSLLLQAGAKKVYFIMAKQKDLGEAFSLIADQLEGSAVVAESGGLSELLTPGIFFFLRSPKDQIIKKHYLKYKPIMVINGDSGFDFEPERLSFSNKLFTLSPVEK